MANNKEWVKNLIAALGGDQAVAENRGLKPSAVRVWVHQGYIPSKHHFGIITLAKKMGITPPTLDELNA